MSVIPFTKMHGIGNDFVLIDLLNNNYSVSWEAVAPKVCHRNFGVGADGILLILPSEVADYRMRIINSDGSEAQMCGNGIRTFARYLYECGITEKSDLTVETLAGIIRPRVLEDGRVCVDMGEPRLQRQEIPMLGAPGKVVAEPLMVDGKPLNVTAVSMGNPHCITFVPDLDAIELTAIGPKVETHEAFPEKTNAEFAQIIDRQNIRMKVWERGAGITLACGTGACATLVAAVLNGLTDRKATLHLPGGELLIEWTPENRLSMTGPAEIVYTGVLEL